MKAIVTGHSKGLGAAIADELLSRGFTLLGIARSSRGAAEGLTQVELDLSDTPRLEAWLAQGALRRFLAGTGQALLINNAGLLQPMGPAHRR